MKLFNKVLERGSRVFCSWKTLERGKLSEVRVTGAGKKESLITGKYYGFLPFIGPHQPFIKHLWSNLQANCLYSLSFNRWRLSSTAVKYCTAPVVKLVSAGIFLRASLHR